jgi:putative PIN family toxin of toxin-antitoxin system
MTKSTFRAVLDTNVVIAALKSRNPKSPNAELLRRWTAGEFDLLYCDDLQGEYREKFGARKVAFGLWVSFLRDLSLLGHHIALTPDQIQPLVPNDPDDDVVIACALAGQASHLVTYDPHLLDLAETFPGLTILDGLHFLYVVRGDRPPLET